MARMTKFDTLKAMRDHYCLVKNLSGCPLGKHCTLKFAPFGVMPDLLHPRFYGFGTSRLSEWHRNICETRLCQIHNDTLVERNNATP